MKRTIAAVATAALLVVGFATTAQATTTPKPTVTITTVKAAHPVRAAVVLPHGYQSRGVSIVLLNHAGKAVSNVHPAPGAYKAVVTVKYRSAKSYEQRYFYGWDQYPGASVATVSCTVTAMNPADVNGRLSASFDCPAPPDQNLTDDVDMNQFVDTVYTVGQTVVLHNVFFRGQMVPRYVYYTRWTYGPTLTSITSKWVTVRY